MSTVTLLERNILDAIKRHIAPLEHLAQFAKVPAEDAYEALLPAKGAFAVAEAARQEMSAQATEELDALKVHFARLTPLVEGAAVDAAQVVLHLLDGTPRLECPDAFLHCWMNGDFDSVRREWPEVGTDLFVGADTEFKLPLRDHPDTNAA